MSDLRHSDRDCDAGHGGGDARLLRLEGVEGSARLCECSAALPLASQYYGKETYSPVVQNDGVFIAPLVLQSSGG